MSRSTVPGLKRFRGPAVLFAVLALALLLPSLASACGEEGGEDTGPLVSKIKVSPPGLPHEGGQVAVYATVEDDCGVFMVYAGMYGPEGNSEWIQMLPWEIAPNGVATYRGEANIPPNYQEYAVNYGFIVQATDTNGGFIEEYAGDVEVAGLPPFDEAPIVSDPVVQPRQLPAAGGPVTIRATASDNRSVSEVYATVASPGGGSSQVPLEPISSSEFEGVFTAPPNPGTTPAQYGIEITALDDIGQPGTVDAGQVSVAASPPKATGRLAVRPATRNFGRVRVGKSSWRWILVRNAGPRSTAPLEGVIQSSGGPFSLLGTGAEGIHFRLRPGEFRFYAVAFRPTVPGPQSGSVTITRTDGGQPGLAVGLSGEGVPPRPPPKCRPSRCPRGVPRG